MKKFFHTKSLKKSGILSELKARPGAGEDLLILPDFPAVRQFRQFFASSPNSAPFITTFASLARRHNALRADRKQIISRTARALLMRKAAENRFVKQADGFANRMEKTKLTAQLLRINAGLKQNAASAASVLEKAKGNPRPGIFEKISAIEPTLTEFEKQMENSQVLDDTTAITELARAIEKGKAREINGKIRRVIVAGFHALAPSHLKVAEAAEKAGIPVAQIFAGCEDEKTASPPDEKIKVFLSSFPFFSNEAEFAASEIRRMIDGGMKLDDFAVIVRNLNSGSAAIADAFERNGVPVSIQTGRNLGTACPISVFLKDLLAAAERSFGGKNFLTLLRNPMLKNFFSDTENILEATSEMEMFLLKKGEHNSDFATFEKLIEPLRGKPYYEKARRKITELKRLLSAYLPGGSPLKTGEIFSGLSMIVDKTGANKNILPQDGSLDEARNFLREAAFFSEKWNCETGSYSEFSAFIQYLLSERSYLYKTRSDGACVPAMNALQARGTSCPVAFVLDFSERSFPYPPPQTILNNEEKKLANRLCARPIFTTDEAHIKDERLIWKSVSLCAEREMRISFSRNGGQKNLSHFFEDFRETESSEIQKEEKKNSDFMITEGRIHSPETARAAAFFSEGEISAELEKLLAENDPFFHLAENISNGIYAEKQRLRAEGSFCEFEGIVKNSERNNWMKELHVSDIEKFGTCPFMFFCSSVLRIKQNLEGGEIPAPSDTGSLYHAALKDLFTRAAQKNVWEISSSEAERILDEFLNCEETKDLHCRVSDDVWRLQKQRARRTVGNFFEVEKKRIRDGKFKPKLFEKEIQFQIDGAEIRGRFDRMDITPGGGGYVVDYKKRSVPKNLCSRENLQIPLYLEHICGELKIPPEGGGYLSIERPWETNKRTARSRGGVPIKAAMEFTRNCVDLARRGFFPPVAVKKSDDFPFDKQEIILKFDRPCRFCQYSDICRVKENTARTAEIPKAEN